MQHEHLSLLYMFVDVDVSSAITGWVLISHRHISYSMMQLGSILDNFLYTVSSFTSLSVPQNIDASNSVAMKNFYAPKDACMPG